MTGQCRGDVMGIECNGPCTGFEHQGTGQSRETKQWRTGTLQVGRRFGWGLQPQSLCLSSGVPGDSLSMAGEAGF